MSWDVSFFGSPHPPRSLAELPKDWRGTQLGALEEVRAIISRSFPETDWSDPHWGSLSTPRFFLEFNLGPDDPCESFAVHVRGGAEAVDALLRLAREPGWYALDMTQGEWLHLAEDPYRGLRRFHSYQDRVVSTVSNKRRFLSRLFRR